jgi:hypothetical protein
MNVPNEQIKTWSQHIDFQLISSRFVQASNVYSQADPFPHVVFQDLFDLVLLREVVKEFPPPEGMDGSFRGVEQGGKSYLQEYEKLGPASRELIAALNSGPFVRALCELTSIKHLISDPYLSGGGLHQTGKGGRLKIHSDFNFHSELRLSRRVNLLIYLNEGWEDSWGGNLELWDKDMSHAVVSVSPKIGSVVVFTCSDTSYHGLPDDIKCPDDVYRKSIAMYYYSVPEDTAFGHSTIWKERPEDNFMKSPLVRIRNSAPYFYRGLKTLFRGS